MEKETLDFMKYFSEPKEFLEKKVLSFPVQDDDLALMGKGNLTENAYVVNINRKRCIFKRITYQNRVDKTGIILARLDIDTKPHHNPDGTRIGGTHLHLYQEGFGDRMAFALDDVENIQKILPTYKPILLEDGEHLNNFQVFARFCDFTNFPKFQQVLELPLY